MSKRARWPLVAAIMILALVARPSSATAVRSREDRATPSTQDTTIGASRKTAGAPPALSEALDGSGIRPFARLGTDDGGARPAWVEAAPGSSRTLTLVGQVGGRTEGVAVQDDYAFVAVGLRVVVLDVSQPLTPTQVGSTTPFPAFVEGVTVSGTLVYVADGIAGLRIVDISDLCFERRFIHALGH
ncbi:MAG: hypothetical protein PVG71_16835, partial [Anaerolineae bacterium]